MRMGAGLKCFKPVSLPLLPVQCLGGQTISWLPASLATTAMACPRAPSLIQASSKPRDRYNFRATRGVGVPGLVNHDMSRYIQRAVVGNPQVRKHCDAQKASWYILGRCMNVPIAYCLSSVLPDLSLFGW